MFASGGSEAIDVAIKTARRATGRRRIVTLAAGYHGRTGLSGAAGEDAGAAYFLSDLPDQFAKVPFADLDAIAVELVQGRRGSGAARDGAGDLRLPGAARTVICRRSRRCARSSERSVHRRRGSDGTGADRPAVGGRDVRGAAGHPGQRQGPVRRHVPDRRHRDRPRGRRSGCTRTGGDTSRPSAAPRSGAGSPSACWRSPPAPRCRMHIAELIERIGDGPVRAARAPALPGRGAPERSGHRPARRPSRRGHLPAAGAVRARGVGDRLGLRSVGPAVQARPAARRRNDRHRARAARGGAGPRQGRRPAGPEPARPRQARSRADHRRPYSRIRGGRAAERRSRRSAAADLLRAAIARYGLSAEAEVTFVRHGENTT